MRRSRQALRSHTVLLSLTALTALAAAGCASRRTAIHEPSEPPSAAGVTCDLAAAGAWIEKWFAAWDLASQRILRLPDAPPPDIVFFDSACVYTTSEVTAAGAPVVDGPRLRGTKLSWRARAHGGSLTLPNSSQVPVGLMTFADVAKGTGPYFVMAAPPYWAEQGHVQEPGLTGVFLHEFAHTRQVGGLQHIIGPIDAAWPYPEELDDDAVQTHFEADPEYVKAYLAERDLLYRAADAGSTTEARALAAEALAMMRGRQARWFTGDKAVFATLDNVFLAMEGVGQWTAYAWLAHPDGGGLDRDAAIQRMLGRRRKWTQDEGLALFLVVNRLLPEWPALEFGVPSPGALDLLERAVQQDSSGGKD
jgi:hypothetical protein